MIIRAPGRINLIGEHTDYNDGFVLPVAIDKEVQIVLRKTSNQKVDLYSSEFSDQIEFNLDNFGKKSGWGEYIKGTAWALQNEGYQLRGWQGILSSDIPQGAGLSSSAAVEEAAIQAFSYSSNLKLEKIEMARLGQRAEYDWVGVKCGIMDQMTSANGKKDHALLIDCRSLEIKDIKLPSDISFVVLDTMTRHKLVESDYNQKRAECVQAAELLGISSLRDISVDEFHEKKSKLPPIISKRAEHVIQENRRVLNAVNALETGDSKKLGKLISSSHVSLRDLFEVSSPELNQIVECAMQQHGCLGARMMGAGFGGSAIAIVESDQAADFVKSVRNCYKVKTGIDAEIHPCKAVDGVEILPFTNDIP